MRFLVFCAVTLLAIPVSVLQDSRLQIPDKQEEKDAQKNVRDIFKEEYGRKSTADKLNLAKKLLAQGLQSNNSAATQYVLFREAQDLAVQVGSFEVVISAIGELAKKFRVDGLTEKVTALGLMSKNVRTLEELKAGAEANLGLAAEAMDLDSYDLAAKSAEVADSMARRAKDLPLVTKAAGLKKDAGELKQNFEKVRKAQETLLANADDPGANLAVGQYQCWMKGNWGKGLPLLVKGSDAAVQIQAQKDMSDPSQGSEQSAVADGWWDLAEKETGKAKENLRARALLWYLKAYDRLEGLSKVKVEKRIVLLRGKNGETRPDGKVVDGPPRGWGVVLGAGEKAEGLALDETRSHTGKASFRIKPGRVGMLVTHPRPIAPSQDCVLSFWYLAENTVVPDLLQVWLIDKSDKTAKSVSALMPVSGSLPFWTRVELKMTSPPETSYFRLVFNQTGMREGCVWLDDLSLKGSNSDKELLDNPGFEDK